MGADRLVLVLAGEHDAHANRVCAELDALGVESALLDTSSYPGEVSLAWDCSDQASLSLRLRGGRLVTGDEIGAVWSRRRPQPNPGRIVDPAVRRWAADESMALLDSLPHFLPVPWLDPPDVAAVASRKPLGLMCARQVGLAIPQTFVGNSHEHALAFAAAHDYLAVKSVAVPFVDLEDSPASSNAQGIVMYTRRLSREEVQRASGITLSPLIIQRYVEKEYELRVTVVGDEVLACGIRSQASSRTRHDWRKYDLENTPHETVVLPPPIAERCLALMGTLGLRFGCLDFIVTPEGEYVFLECNPVGAFLWIEELTNLPISRSLAELLAGLVEQGSSTTEGDINDGRRTSAGF